MQMYPQRFRFTAVRWEILSYVTALSSHARNRHNGNKQMLHGLSLVKLIPGVRNGRIREKIPDLWELDSLGIKDPSEEKSKLELQDLALKHFENTVLRDDEGGCGSKLMRVLRVLLPIGIDVLVRYHSKDISRHSARTEAVYDEWIPLK
ncbi:hypothetical protein TNCV_4496681 [Trichonephila clavipes]|nr:hypothetical protein TNCV_4496681 [Trichonephila clavipes]